MHSLLYNVVHRKYGNISLANGNKTFRFERPLDEQEHATDM